MTPTLLSSLSDSDYLLVRATGAGELRGLDEDALLDLHGRIRRARNKHIGVYRRAAAKRVSAKGARGAARRGNVDNLARAEIFEDALARVSRQLGIVAKQSARDLKDARIAAARSAPPSAPGERTGRSEDSAAPAGGKTPANRRVKTAVGKKRVASSRAAGARRQAKRDSR
jgi:hypothetical protein